MFKGGHDCKTVTFHDIDIGVQSESFSKVGIDLSIFSMDDMEQQNTIRLWKATNTEQIEKHT